MISLEKCKEVNKPNILLRSGSRWTHGAQHNGLKHKGVEYLFFDCDLDIYNKAKIFGGKDFWEKDNGLNMTKYMANPKEIEKWLDVEERKVYAEVKNSVLGR